MGQAAVSVFVPSISGAFDAIEWDDFHQGEETGTLLKTRYRLGRKIAQGGFGVTYMATDEDCLNEQVLIKFLHRLPGLDLFRAEARRLLDLNHPQIPRLKAYFELKDDTAPDDASRSKYVLVMDVVHGRNLVEILDDEGPWSDVATYRMVVSVLKVLYHVHNKGVIHRDIKAANIMRRETDGIFFVVDFGACTTHATDDLVPKLIGTKGYMAPESSAGRCCCESDLYSLGATGLFMLRGVEPVRLIDKAHPEDPFAFELMSLKNSGKASERAFSVPLIYLMCR